MNALVHKITNSHPGLPLAAALVTISLIVVLTMDLWLAVAMSLALFALVFFCRKPMFLLFLWPMILLIQQFLPLRFRAAGFLFTPMDLAYFMSAGYLAFCALTRPRAVGRFLKDNLFLSLFLGLVVVYALVYTTLHGQSALGEARKFYGMFMFPLVAHFVLKRPEDLKKFIQVLTFAAISLVVFALARGAAFGSIIRVINSEATLIIAFAAFTMAILGIHRTVLFSRAIDTVVLVICAGLAIILAQRSVWLAVGCGTLTALWLFRGRPILMIKGAILGLTLLMTFGAALVYLPEVGTRLGAKFAGLIDPYSDRTGSWRIEGWRVQLNKVWEENLLLGEGVGGYYSWKRRGAGTVERSPHNGYVQLILKFGLVGLTVYALLAFQFFRKCLAARRKLQPGPMKSYLEIGIISFAAGHGYLMGYGFEPIMLIFFGVALSAVTLSQASFGMSEAHRVRRNVLTQQRTLRWRTAASAS